MDASKSAKTFVLRAGRELTEIDDQCRALDEIDDVKILERRGRLLRVEGIEDRLQEFVRRHAGWKLAPEVRYSVPEGRPVPRRPPSSD